jgi:hypothetical protein
MVSPPVALMGLDQNRIKIPLERYKQKIEDAAVLRAMLSGLRFRFLPGAVSRPTPWSFGLI